MVRHNNIEFEFAAFLGTSALKSPGVKTMAPSYHKVCSRQESEGKPHKSCVVVCIEPSSVPPAPVCIMVVMVWFILALIVAAIIYGHHDGGCVY